MIQPSHHIPFYSHEPYQNTVESLFLASATTPTNKLPGILPEKILAQASLGGLYLVMEDVLGLMVPPIFLASAPNTRRRFRFLASDERPCVGGYLSESLGSIFPVGLFFLWRFRRQISPVEDRPHFFKETVLA